LILIISSTKTRFILGVYRIYRSFFNSSDYSIEHKMTGQLKNNEFEMLPKEVVMAQSSICLEEQWKTIKTSVQIPGLGAET
jgi:hypothetical protein